MTELKPCPKGCDSFIDVGTREIDESWWSAIVRCADCGIELRRGAQSEKEALEKAIEAWNTRAERTCHPVEKFTEDSPWPVMVCSECGRQLHYDEHREISYQPYCGCGAKVVE